MVHFQPCRSGYHTGNPGQRNHRGSKESHRGRSVLVTAKITHGGSSAAMFTITWSQWQNMAEQRKKQVWFFSRGCGCCVTSDTTPISDMYTGQAMFTSCNWNKPLTKVNRPVAVMPQRPHDKAYCLVLWQFSCVPRTMDVSYFIPALQNRKHECAWLQWVTDML